MSSLFQNAYYLAINFNAILYGTLHTQIYSIHDSPSRLTQIAGTELVLYGATLNALVYHRKKWAKRDRFYMAFSTALLILITIYMSTEAVFGQEMWIVHAGFPGGAAAYLEENADIWYQTLGTTASVVLNALADALLVRLHRTPNLPA